MDDFAVFPPYISGNVVNQNSKFSDIAKNKTTLIFWCVIHAGGQISK